MLVVDGRGERASQLAGVYRDHDSTSLASQALPHSLGLLYEDLTEHLGLPAVQRRVQGDGDRLLRPPAASPTTCAPRLPYEDGGFRPEPIDWDALAPPRRPTPGPDLRVGRPEEVHADSRCSVQAVLEEILLDLVAGCAGGRTRPALPGGRRGAQLRCQHPDRPPRVRSPEVWVQPAAGDAGTALGAALALAAGTGDAVEPMARRGLGRGWTDEEIGAALDDAASASSGPAIWPPRSATRLPTTQLIGWFQGRSEFGPRALGAVRCWPTRATPGTWSGSTTSRAGNSSVRSRRWCWRTGPPRCSSGTDSQPVHAVRARRRPERGVSGFRRSSTSTAPRASRRSNRPQSRWSDHRPSSRELTGVPVDRQHQPQHRRPADGGHPARRAGVLRLFAGGPAGHRPVPGTAATMKLDCAIVVPTIGRESVQRLLSALDEERGPAPDCVVVVDDRADPRPPLVLDTRLPVTLLHSGGRGPPPPATSGGAPPPPVGSRSSTTTWCRTGLADAPRRRPDRRGVRAAAGSQGVLVVPTATERRSTDDERRTQRLATARWITADMAYRRDVLVAVGGFDERFPRAYREDSDLALRVVSSGDRIIGGTRRATHPVASSTVLSSVRAQIGNRATRRCVASRPRSATPDREGPDGCPPTWRPLPRERRVSLGRSPGDVGRRPRMAIGWLALTAQFTVRRFLRGPHTMAEAGADGADVGADPPGRGVAPAGRGVDASAGRPERVLAVLLDRDDTIIEDGPFLNDPTVFDRSDAAQRWAVRERGLLLAIVTNQSGVARGSDQSRPAGRGQRQGRCRARSVRRLAGLRARRRRPVRVPQTAAGDGARRGRCPWRAAERCVMIGDTGGDVNAALAANARAVLVPTDRTRVEEITHARDRAKVAASLTDAVSMVLRSRDEHGARGTSRQCGRRADLRARGTRGRRGTRPGGDARRAARQGRGRAVARCRRDHRMAGAAGRLRLARTHRRSRRGADEAAARRVRGSGVHVHVVPPVAVASRCWPDGWRGLGRCGLRGLSGHPARLRHHVEDGVPEPLRALPRRGRRVSLPTATTGPRASARSTPCPTT